ncbi:MAG: hypothetical protein ACYC27_03415, partial [Armatimonadota bacterium]
YMTILAAKRGLRREQIGAALQEALTLNIGTRTGANADDANALRIDSLSAWELSELRRALSQEIMR